MTFEELGIDRLFVDEAHYFKNLFYVSKMTRITGFTNGFVRVDFYLWPIWWYLTTHRFMR